MARRIPSGGRARGGDNCPLLAVTARFLIWATRHARQPEPAADARAEAGPRPAAGNPAICS
ncbi:MAG TPA: hypothetical protein VMG08_06225 [Allosphingosinicella sp.]|nr:hypothetical protein [Allosphingosinicella sp.]